MSTILATHQPNYIPWMGYFYKISQCDIFVFLDDVQFSKTGSHNYHYIKTSQGSLKLKIPVAHGFVDPINKVKTNDIGGWKKKHLQEIEKNYNKAPFFNQIMADFEKVLLQDYENLASLNESIILFILKKFNINTQIEYSSTLNIDVKNQDRIIEICKKLNATTYYSGQGAKAYQNEEDFNKNGLELVYDNFKPQEYTQLWGEFQTNVTVLDYLMNYGYDWEYYKSLIEKNLVKV
jgi:hypothetical protein